jgi:hypothetical protein
MYGDETDLAVTNDLNTGDNLKKHEDDEEEMKDIQKTLGHLEGSHNPFKEPIFGVIKDEP